MRCIVDALNTSLPEQSLLDAAGHGTLPHKPPVVVEQFGGSGARHADRLSKHKVGFEEIGPQGLGPVAMNR